MTRWPWMLTLGLFFLAGCSTATDFAPESGIAPEKLVKYESKLGSGEIYVTGEVLKPGVFKIQPHQYITVKMVLAAAGPHPFLYPENGTLYRRVGGKQEIIPVDIERIIKGEEAGPKLQAGDIFLVGRHEISQEEPD